jgi:hypothetical protein
VGWLRRLWGGSVGALLLALLWSQLRGRVLRLRLLLQ